MLVAWFCISILHSCNFREIFLLMPSLIRTISLNSLHWQLLLTNDGVWRQSKCWVVAVVPSIYSAYYPVDFLASARLSGCWDCSNAFWIFLTCFASRRKQCSNWLTTLQTPWFFPRSEVARGKYTHAFIVSLQCLLRERYPSLFS